MTVLRRLLMAAGGGSGGSFASTTPTNLFAMFNGQNGTGEYHIGQASYTFATNTWAEDAGNPVLSKSGANWVSDLVKDPWVMPDGLAAYVSGYNGTRFQIGRVTRPNTSSAVWTYDSTSSPTLALGGAGAPDEHGLAFPTVLDDGAGAKRFKMWYRGEDAAGFQSVCYAYSADGLSWTKVGIVLTTGAGGTWEDVGTGPAGIVKDAGTYYLFYGGRSSASAPVFWQGGVATFTDPEGTYTKYAGNPTLTNTVGITHISRPLTANTASGSAVVTVSDTSAWLAGYTMILVDADSESEIHRIASVDSGTQITLDATVSSSFTTVNGAVIREVNIISVLPRSVLRATSGWQMFYTPFQPQDDLSSGGTQLREMAMRATASSLTGAWTRDDATGLLFPLYPTTSGWHKFSAENPSVIPAP